jgi:hypothetical protein
VCISRLAREADEHERIAAPVRSQPRDLTVMGRRSRQTEREKLLALPHTKLIDGNPYVRICYRDVDSKWKDKSRRVDSVDEAIIAIAKLKRELGLSDPVAHEGDQMTFDQLLALYHRRHP